jgi:hypothetical protein
MVFSLVIIQECLCNTWVSGADGCKLLRLLTEQAGHEPCSRGQYPRTGQAKSNSKSRRRDTSLDSRGLYGLL